jgi:mono/diheme cytochrome c family protein
MTGRSHERRWWKGRASSRIAVLGAAGLLTYGGGVTAQIVTSGVNTSAGVYTNEQAAQGQTIFEKRCSACHGSDLGGGDMAPALHGAEFLSAWTGKPLRRIYSRIISTMPPDDVGSLTESETLAVVALVLKANGYPAGSQALARADDLNSIAVTPPAGER